jgi:cell division protein FtsB
VGGFVGYKIGAEEREKLKTDVAKLNREVGELRAKQAKPDPKVEKLEAEVKKLKAQLAKPDPEVKELKDQMKKLETRLQRMEEENEALKKENKRLEKENEELKKENEKLKKENERLEKENERLEKENERLEKENEKLKKENEKLKKENEVLKTQVEEPKKNSVRWDEVAGLEGAKEALNEAVIMPTKFPHLFKGLSRWMDGWGGMAGFVQLEGLKKVRGVPFQVSASRGVGYSSSDRRELASHTSRRPSPTKRRAPLSSPYPAVTSSASGLASRNGKASLPSSIPSSYPHPSERLL